MSCSSESTSWRKTLPSSPAGGSTLRGTPRSTIRSGWLLRRRIAASTSLAAEDRLRRRWWRPPPGRRHRARSGARRRGPAAPSGTRARNASRPLLTAVGDRELARAALDQAARDGQRAVSPAPSSSTEHRSTPVKMCAPARPRRSRARPRPRRSRSRRARAARPRRRSARSGAAPAPRAPDRLGQRRGLLAPGRGSRARRAPSTRGRWPPRAGGAPPRRRA